MRSSTDSVIRVLAAEQKLTPPEFTTVLELKLSPKDLPYHVNVETASQIPMWRRGMHVKTRPRRRDPCFVPPSLPALGLTETWQSLLKGLTRMKLCCVPSQSSTEEIVDVLVADPPCPAVDTFWGPNTRHVANRNDNPAEQDSSKPGGHMQATCQSDNYEGSKAVLISQGPAL
mmetsp:Transcript_68422/g.135194  ORF Transcript_68422/g.135194 Transcript_68422/m.135194 type:complete len:173 (+) Transcript_68422:50-568(+)